MKSVYIIMVLVILVSTLGCIGKEQGTQVSPTTSSNITTEQLGINSEIKQLDSLSNESDVDDSLFNKSSGANISISDEIIQNK